jgi:hypothetical protein
MKLVTFTAGTAPQPGCVAGDRVRGEIEGSGALDNPVAAEA